MNPAIPRAIEASNCQPKPFSFLLHGRCNAIGGYLRPFDLAPLPITQGDELKRQVGLTSFGNQVLAYCHQTRFGLLVGGLPTVPWLVRLVLRAVRIYRSAKGRLQHLLNRWIGRSRKANLRRVIGWSRCVPLANLSNGSLDADETICIDGACKISKSRGLHVLIVSRVIVEARKKKRAGRLLDGVLHDAMPGAECASK